MTWNKLRSWLNPFPKPARKNRSRPQRRALLSVEPLETRLVPSFSVGPNVNISKSPADDGETAIAINPTNPLNLFAISTAEQASTGGSGCWYSTNGGLTWFASDISQIYTGTGGGDQQVAWDQYGNLFMTYFAIDFNGDLDSVVALSTNGGKTFKISLDTRDPEPQDQPTVVVGPGSVWYTSNGGNLPHVMRGAAVTGLGQVGPWGYEQAVPFTFFFGDTAVGPNGQVFVVGQQVTGEDPAFIFGALDPDGLGPIPLGGVNGQFVVVAATNVGSTDLIPAQPNRGIDAEANLAWDRTGGPFNGRLYMVYTDETSDESNDTDIWVTYSDNNGLSWSSRVRVNDDPLFNGRGQFLPGIAVDQTTGNVGIAWYDCRNDPRNARPEVWMSISHDGGVTWLPNQVLSTPLTGQSRTPPNNNDFDFGDYNKADFYAGKFFYSWADNSNSTGDNPAGFYGFTDVYTAPVTVIGGPGTGPPSGGGVDFTEPNDRSNQAYRLGTLTSPITLTNLAIKNKPALDQDWYRFNSPTTSGTVTITVNILSAAADLDVRLWTVNQFGTLRMLAASAKKQGGGTEQIVYNFTNQKFPFFVQVYGYKGAQGIYDITFADPPRGSSSSGSGGSSVGGDRFESNDTRTLATALGVLSAPRTESGLSILNKPIYDQDWFRFQVSTSGTLTVRINITTAADLDIRLYRLSSTGTLVQVGASSKRMAGGYEQISLSAAPGVAYFLQVNGYAGAQGSYDLLITPP